MTWLKFALKTQFFCTESSHLHLFPYIEPALEKVLLDGWYFYFGRQSPTQMLALLFLLSQEGLIVEDETADISKVNLIFALLPYCPSKCLT